MIMDTSEIGKNKRWYRVSQTTPSFRFVDVAATSQTVALLVAESVDDDQFLEMDDDVRWETFDVKEIPAGDVCCPVI